jgi:hypothetical protein
VIVGIHFVCSESEDVEKLSLFCVLGLCQTSPSLVWEGFKGSIIDEEGEREK